MFKGNDEQAPLVDNDNMDNFSHVDYNNDTEFRPNPNNLWNIARDFLEPPEFQVLQLRHPSICNFCQAHLFEGERETFCCKNGKVLLPAIPAPPELHNLFSDQTPEGRSFRKDIRGYNHVFSFTSMGVTLDEAFTNAPGVHTFRAHGSVYHKIGPLLPTPGTRPRFLQMFIYDTEHEIENRLRERNTLNRHLIEKIQRILNAHNSFIKTFRQLSQNSGIIDCRLLIKARPAEDRQYVVPSESQVAAVICNNDDLSHATNRDIVIQKIGGDLITVSECASYYDPLQYPLLLPYGTYGWDINNHTIHGQKVTCCDYYSYMLQVSCPYIYNILKHFRKFSNANSVFRNYLRFDRILPSYYMEVDYFINILWTIM